MLETPESRTVMMLYELQREVREMRREMKVRFDAMEARLAGAEARLAGLTGDSADPHPTVLPKEH
ncbi:hypothetical protein [Psychromarinibacter sp. S121]|uniref:hypothetical protein n=1 Tax=Psychromarinibacter sp. S121 TaxID=3415127 RepID=UPI003C7C5AD3